MALTLLKNEGGEKRKIKNGNLRSGLNDNLENAVWSYVGTTCQKGDQGSGRKFCPGEYKSAFLQDRAKYQKRYNEINFEDLIIKIHSVFRSKKDEEIIRLNEQLTPYLMLLDLSPVNPLAPLEKKKVKFVLDKFSQKLMARTTVLQAWFLEEQKKIDSWSGKNDSYKHLTEMLGRADSFSQEYLWWRGQSWLDDKLKVEENSKIEKYGETTRIIKTAEEGFWQDYIKKYSSKIFSSDELKEEMKYVCNKIKEQFGRPSSRTIELKLWSSLPERIQRELLLLDGNLKYYNEIKTFARQALREMEEEKKRIEAGLGGLDEIIELRNIYLPLSEKFKRFDSDLIYYHTDALKYEEEVSVFRRWLRQKERESEEKIVHERKTNENKRKKTESEREHPLVIKSEDFSIPVYLGKYLPKNKGFTRIKELLSQKNGQSWQAKLDEIGSLLQKPPEFYSQKDKSFLNEVIFSLETSLRDGVIGYFAGQDDALRDKAVSTINQMKQYAENYNLA